MKAEDFKIGMRLQVVFTDGTFGTIKTITSIGKRFLIFDNNKHNKIGVKQC